MKKFNLVTNQNALVKSAVVPVGTIYGTLKIRVRQNRRISIIPVDYILLGFTKHGEAYLPVVRLRHDYVTEDFETKNRWTSPTIMKTKPFYLKIADRLSDLCAEHNIKVTDYIYNPQSNNIMTHKVCASVAPKDRIIPTPIYHCGYMSPNTGTEDMEVVRYGFDGEIYNNLTPRAKKYNCGKRHD
jgi:hypothetical protein